MGISDDILVITQKTCFQCLIDSEKRKSKIKMKYFFESMTEILALHFCNLI